MASTKDNRFLLTASADRSVKVWDLELKEMVHQFVNIHSGIHAFLLFRFTLLLLDFVIKVLLSKNDRFIITAAEGGIINVFDARTKQQVHRYTNIHKGTQVFIYVICLLI